VIRVGFGVTALAKAQAGGAHDGLSHYTQELLTRFEQRSDLACVPFSFGTALPAVDRMLLGDDQHAAPEAHPDAHPKAQSQVLRPYPAAAAWSVLSGQDFIGVDRLASRIDLLHATDHHIPKCQSVPVVATLMDAIPFSHPEWTNGSFRSLKNALWRQAIGWADRVITISEYSKSELVKWAGVDPEKIDVISLGVDQRWFSEVTAELCARVRQTHRLPNTFFISVGTLQPRKNVLSTIQAHRALSPSERKQYPLVIVGRAGWKCEEVIALIEQDSRSGMVRWLPKVTDEDLFVIVKLSQGLVFPSLAEGFGLPVLEAFAAQVPVITSNTTSLPEVAGDSALCVPPLDVEAIAEALRQLIDDTALRQTLKQKGLNRALQFSWNTCADSTFAVYQKALAS
jgi:alpha-1,3-rhamnosyl/mannosyltransferase